MLIAGIQTPGQAHPPLPLSLALGASGVGLRRSIFALDMTLDLTPEALASLGSGPAPDSGCSGEVWPGPP